MTLKERCQAGEAKLEHVSNALLDPRPEILDHCEAELQEVIAILSEPADSSALPAVSGRPVPSDRNDLLRLRRRIRMLVLQVQNAINLCQGWAQLGLSQGYTDQGRPVLPPSEPQASFEV
ncbi:MAG: hypothetical protein LAP61_24300 [Acidobacteriia bacterium]|nr:hypothetical protein [Terriglobia bacterium]